MTEMASDRDRGRVPPRRRGGRRRGEPEGRVGRALPDRRPELALPAGDLRLVCDGSALGGEPAEVAAADGMVGQERAVEALEMGLAVRGPGYHVFVAGPPGTGRTTALRSVLARLAAGMPPPPDRAYVHRFDDPDRPRLLTLAPGRAAPLAQALDQFREGLAARTQRLLEDPELDRRREAIRRRYAREEEARFGELQAALAADGFGIVPLAVGGGMVMPEVAPIRDGEPVALDQLEAELPPEEIAQMRARAEEHGASVREHFAGVRRREREFNLELRELVRDAAAALVVEELASATEGAEGDVAAFLDDVGGDALAAIVQLGGSGAPGLEAFQRRVARYRVNVLSDHSRATGAPIIEERFPTRQNLVGAVERAQQGPLTWRADASTIRGGSLVRADGGFLVAQALDLISEPGAWEQVKRAVGHAQLEIGGSSPSVFGLPRPIEPDPMPLDVKVVLIGERWVHDLLHAADPEFRRLFGVRADFATDMRRTPAALARYAAVVAAVCREEGLPEADPGALGALVEEGVKVAGRRSRITTRFSHVADMLREAAFLARGRGAGRIERADVEEAARRRERRDGAPAERLLELTMEDVLLVATDGVALGQVNGLSVLDLGYVAFGKPTRITASAAPGRAGIINIEREARLSGGLYDKGVLTIGGFLRRRYADLGPLSLTASLTFEQSYAGVDGDSASIAEVVALVSELSGLPVDQAVAITGSINQHGEVQPVGGVNEKVTAFHALCAARGLTGGHGVILPRQNVEDLMLQTAIVADATAGRFHVLAVRSVEEALEIALDAPIDEIDGRARRRLAAFSAALGPLDDVRRAPEEPGAPPTGLPSWGPETGR
jgi:lon-related putative ATP-dependent protease